MSIVSVTRQNLKETIEHNQIVIFDFWADWCTPCRRFSPIFESVALRFPDVKFVKVNTDLEEELAETFEIRSLPTIAVMKDQDIILLQPGAVSEDILEQIVKNAKAVDMDKVRTEEPN